MMQCKDTCALQDSEARATVCGGLAFASGGSTSSLGTQPFTSEQMDQFFEAACRLLDDHETAAAADAFLFLAVTSPDTLEYWLHLGKAEEQRSDLTAALEAYSMAVYADGSNPLPRIHAARCYLLRGHSSTALRCLSMAFDCASANPDYAYLIGEIGELRSQLVEEEG